MNLDLPIQSQSRNSLRPLHSSEMNIKVLKNVNILAFFLALQPSCLQVWQCLHFILFTFQILAKCHLPVFEQGPVVNVYLHSESCVFYNIGCLEDSQHLTINVSQ